MKNLFLTIAMISTTSLSQAKSLSCQTAPLNQQAEAGITGHLFLQLDAKMIVSDYLKDVTAKATFMDYNDDQKVEIARSAELVSDQNYNPTKYQGYVRYDLSKLTTIKNFSRFYPADTCQILVHLPENADTKSSFSAPVLVHCDQSGGRTTMKCVVK